MSNAGWIVAIAVAVGFIVLEIFGNIYLEMLFAPIRAAIGAGCAITGHELSEFLFPDSRILIKEVKKAR